MTFDYYASFNAEDDKSNPNDNGLSSGFIDCCTALACNKDEKDEIRKKYMEFASGEKIFPLKKIDFNPDFESLPEADWLGLEIAFVLKTPWYSKDDRPFHVMDNPVRKDRLFGVPFMAASSWKGLLRWACRMQEGLSEHLQQHGMTMDDWKDPNWIVHLFGNEKGEDKKFQAGALAFYPTWFDRIAFEVINPHDRSTKAGTQPIYYEVVPAGTEGVLRLLYAPAPGAAERDGLPCDKNGRPKVAAAIHNLIDAITALMRDYGISAKRTAGWGTAEIKEEDSKAYFREDGWLGQSSEKFRRQDYEQPKEEFLKFMEKDGSPKKILLDDAQGLKTKTQYRHIKSEKPGTQAEYDAFRIWHKKYGEQYEKILAKQQTKQPAQQMESVPWSNFIEILKILKATPNEQQAGGGK